MRDNPKRLQDIRRRPLQAPQQARIEHLGLDVVDYVAMKEHEDQYPYFQHLRKLAVVLQAA
jgi:hypothetical protein